MKYPQLVSMPTAVSDWLEEQLEARGIDAIVYTRYVLSLLHRDPCDFDQPDSDFGELEHLKGGVNRSGRRGVQGGGRKGLRPGHELPPQQVYQLQRSAAVECLKSASEQKCGIESLVDELCAKLKQVEDETDCTATTVQTERTTKNTTENKYGSKISQEDLARQYYAAFPPLSNNETNGDQQSQSISIIPQSVSFWNNITAKNKNVSKGLNKSDYACKPKGNAMKTKCINGKRFTNYFARNTKKDSTNFGFAMAKSRGMDFWDEHVRWYNQQNNLDAVSANDEGYATSDTIRIDDETADKKNETSDDLEQLVAKFDRSIESLWSPEPNSSNDNLLPDKEDDFQNLPVDFHELLSSPVEQQPPSAELFGIVNKVNVTEQPFIQNGTNITSSIWSRRDNEIEMDCSYSDNSFYDSLLNENLTFKNSSSNQIWSNAKMAERSKANSYYENLTNNNIFDVSFFSKEKDKVGTEESPLAWEIGFSKWSENENDNYDTADLFQTKSNDLRASLLKLNHDESNSSFIEVIPGQMSGMKSLDSNYAIKENETGTQQPDVVAESSDSEDDLLTSLRTHFCPIRLENIYNQHNLPDGSTFDIRASPEHINFRRTESGTLFLDSDLESPKQYMEYKIAGYEEIPDALKEKEFTLKFHVRSNEKYCQTDPETEVSDSGTDSVPVKLRLMMYTPSLAQFEETHSEEESNAWPDVWKSWQQIWSSREELCVDVAPAAPVSLRAELQQEGEQLLSDISSLQPLFCCEQQIDERPVSVREERKRRHSASLLSRNACRPAPKALRSLTF